MAAVWEYKSIARPADEMLTDEQLTKIGALGFELVQVLQVSQEVMVVGKHVTKVTLHYIFKRHAMAAKTATPAQAPSQSQG